jgi:hypothetical protein
VEDSVAVFLDPNLHFLGRLKHIGHTKNTQRTAVAQSLHHMVVGLLWEWCKSGQNILAVVGRGSSDNNSFVLFCMVCTKTLEADNLAVNRMDRRNCCR